jgi:hypothetical protein
MSSGEVGVKGSRACMADGGRESKSDARCAPEMKPREGKATSAEPK